MNVKLITKAMHTLSLLSEEDVAIVMKLRGLSEDERQMLMLVLEPNAKPQKKPASKPRTIPHCDACDYTRRHRVHKVPTFDGYHEFEPKKSAEKKSARASLQQQISGRTQSAIRPPTAATNDDDNPSDTRCHFTHADGKLCFLLPDHNIHHLQTANEHHPFVSTAPDADGESSLKSEKAASAGSSVTQPEDVGVAASGD